MRRFALFLALAGFLGVATAPAFAEDALRWPSVLAQAQAPKAVEPGWTAGKVVAVGVGAIAGIVVANAALPVAWGFVNPVIGVVVGGMIGNWAHSASTEQPRAMVRQPTSIAAEAPSLFQLAALSVETD
ncbi:MAG: hypothetical protein HY246_05205 [Proteobacteria bacterium]|nr:hypothetical protein [Pseudomonadota bacterium]